MPPSSRLHVQAYLQDPRIWSEERDSITSGQMSLALVTAPWCLSLQATSPSVLQPFQVLVAPSACQCCRSAG